MVIMITVNNNTNIKKIPMFVGMVMSFTGIFYSRLSAGGEFPILCIVAILTIRRQLQWRAIKST